MVCGIGGDEKMWGFSYAGSMPYFLCRVSYIIGYQSSDLFPCVMENPYCPAVKARVFLPTTRRHMMIKSASSFSFSLSLSLEGEIVP